MRSIVRTIAALLLHGVISGVYLAMLFGGIMLLAASRFWLGGICIAVAVLWTGLAIRDYGPDDYRL